MTNFPPLRVKNSNVINDFLFCQFIEEGEDGVDVKASPKPVQTTRANDQTTQETRVPIRRRRNTPTTTGVGPTKLPIPGTTTSSPFFPRPPPISAYNLKGDELPTLSPAMLVDPSTGASYHPDFMFCGACMNDKENGGRGPSSGKAHSSDLDDSSSDSESSSTDSLENMNALLQTTFRLGEMQQPRERQQQDHHNEELVLRSLIRAIPGVRKVFIPATYDTTHTRRSSSVLYSENTVVHHDASVLTGTIRHAFESAGYSASVLKRTSIAGTAGAASRFSTDLEEGSSSRNVDGNQTVCWVRSAFDVQGICCSSETPAIRRIVKPLFGVANVNVNLTTKVVHVQHNCVQIKASQIAEALTEQGFPAEVRRDGAASAQFTINNANCDSNSDNNEEMKLKSLAETLDRIGKSPFVESTLIVEGLRPDQVHLIEKAVSDSFIRVQVRAVYPSSISETIKVEHNPDLVSIADIRDFLRREATNENGSSRFPSTVEVYIDGADTNLYLPAASDYLDKPVVYRDDGGVFSWMKKHHINVVLSGLFWILSMVSIVHRLYVVQHELRSIVHSRLVLNVLLLCSIAISSSRAILFLTFVDFFLFQGRIQIFWSGFCFLRVTTYHFKGIQNVKTLAIRR